MKTVLRKIGKALGKLVAAMGGIGSKCETCGGEFDNIHYYSRCPKEQDDKDRL